MPPRERGLFFFFFALNSCRQGADISPRARAGRLVDEMTLRGIAGEAEGPTKPRTVLISREEWRRMQENQE